MWNSTLHPEGSEKRGLREMVVRRTITRTLIRWLWKTRLVRLTMPLGVLAVTTTFSPPSMCERMDRREALYRIGHLFTPRTG